MVTCIFNILGETNFFLRIFKVFPNRIVHNVSKTREEYCCSSKMPLYNGGLSIIMCATQDKNVEKDKI